MAKKTGKKVDPKVVAKKMVNEAIVRALKDLGFDVSDGVEYGFTAYTIVVHTDKTDVQVKLITPKAGMDRYERLEEEGE